MDLYDKYTVELHDFYKRLQDIAHEAEQEGDGLR